MKIASKKQDINLINAKLNFISAKLNFIFAKYTCKYYRPLELCTY